MEARVARARTVATTAAAAAGIINHEHSDCSAWHDYSRCGNCWGYRLIQRDQSVARTRAGVTRAGQTLGGSHARDIALGSVDRDANYQAREVE